jgi:hypothetical protein
MSHQSPGRARVIYQSEALYVGTSDATGAHFAVSKENKGYTNADGTDKQPLVTTGYSTQEKAVSAAGTAMLPSPASWVRTGVQQLRRVQSANYSFSLNRQDVNQFGQLARIDSVVIDPPTVSLDFSYYLTNGVNERLIGLDTLGQSSALTDEFLDGGSAGEGSAADGKNFFISTTSQGRDSVGNTEKEDHKTTIALGNGYVTNYSMEASVGGMPTATVTVEGLNLRSYTGTKNLGLPSVNTNFGTPILEGQQFSLPDAVSGVLDDSPALINDNAYTDEHGFITGIAAETEGWSCLRPGDIEMSLGTDGAAGEFELLPSASPVADYNKGSCHVQNFSIDVPVGRSPLQRLGSPYGYTKVVDFPVTISVSVSAILADLKEGNVASLLWDTEEHDLKFTLREPNPHGTGAKALEYTIKGALLEGESFSSSIGDNKTVDLTFSAQLGSPEDQARGLRIEGSRNGKSITGKYAYGEQTEVIVDSSF